MARFVMRVRASSHETLSFFCPDSGGYVYLESGGRVGVTGIQVCQDGGFAGHALRATPETLPRVARAWRRAYLRQRHGGGSSRAAAIRAEWRALQGVE
jgi:hypothetical protein